MNERFFTEEKIIELLIAGSYKEAAQKADEPIKAGADEKVYLPLKVSAHIEAGETEKALSEAKRLLKLLPRDAYVCFLFLRARFLSGERGLTFELADAIKNGENLTPPIAEKLYNLLGQCYRFLGESKKAAEAYKKAAEMVEQRELKALNYGNYLFNLHYGGNLSPVEARSEAFGYGKLFEGVRRFSHNGKTDRSKLKIGYISPDLREHVVLKFVWALMKHYDRERFAVICYARGNEDAYSEKIKEFVDGWRSIAGLSSEAAAKLIYDDEIDILFDFAGHTKNSCLPVLAHKPAPVQISGIGYFASTGLAAVDYFLSDKYLAGIDTYEVTITKSEEFTEKLIVLPHSHFCYSPFANVPEVGVLPYGKNGFITFGSLNNFTKVTDEVLSAWAKILERVPYSKLFLQTEIFDRKEGRAAAEEKLKRAGIDLARVECRGFVRDYLSAYNEIDLALDTFPYPGGGTTLDALYMGVPVVSLTGRLHGERFGYSILSNLRIEELCASSVEDYIEKAVLFASDVDTLVILRQNLRSLLKKSPLMDAKNYVREIEEAYEIIWKRYLEEQK